MSERSDISLMKCPGMGETSGCGVGEVEERVMMGGVAGFVGGVGGLLRNLLVDPGEESGEEVGKMGGFVAPETADGEEVRVLRGMLGTSNMFQ